MDHINHNIKLHVLQVDVVTIFHKVHKNVANEIQIRRMYNVNAYILDKMTGGVYNQRN